MSANRTYRTPLDMMSSVVQVQVQAPFTFKN